MGQALEAVDTAMRGSEPVGMAIRCHAPTIPIHDVLVNTAPIATEQLDRDAAQGAAPVAPDVELLKALGHAVVGDDLLAAGSEVRHDLGKLARAIPARVP